MDRFERIAGDMGLDFANTVYSSGRSAGSIVSANDVAAFLAETGALNPPEVRRLRSELRASIPAQQRLLHAALSLRDGIRAALDAHDTRRSVPRDAIEAINAVLECGRGSEQLFQERGGFALRFEVARPSIESALVPVALAAARAIVAGGGAVRKCAAAGCIRYFWDDSQTQRRRWCSMQICGNRAKVAAFAARKLHGE